MQIGCIIRMGEISRKLLINRKLTFIAKGKRFIFYCRHRLMRKKMITEKEETSMKKNTQTETARWVVNLKNKLETNIC